MSHQYDIDDFKTGSDYNEQYEYQELEDDERDAAWEEYLSTGIDPTGGELGPDFDPETGEELPDEDYMMINGTGGTHFQSSVWNRLFWLAAIVFFIICIISWINKG